jgi:pimeloyl-ACP methyl ester carboxylesterase
MNTEIDIRHILPAICVPTLILHRTGDLDIDVNGARFMAERIPGAKYVELPGGACATLEDGHGTPCLKPTASVSIAPLLPGTATPRW